MEDPIKGAYWPSWLEDDFPPAKIVTGFLSHVYYAFVSPNAHTFQLDINETIASSLDSFNTTLHETNHPAVKTLLSIGGASDDLSDIFSNMASAQDSRVLFIDSTIQVARKYNFDGVDLHWRFPRTQDDMDNFGIFLAEWREAVNKEAEVSRKPQLLLSAATYYKPQIPFDYARKYPVESINKNLDWINALCYDYHGPWDVTKTGTLSALLDPHGDVSTSDGLESWLEAGIQNNKFVMGLPLYGRSWKLKDPLENGIGAPAVGVGPGDDGYMTYAQVEAFNVEHKAHVEFDDPTYSVYSVAETDWIVYDDERTISSKVTCARSFEVGGYFFWDITADQHGRFSREAAVSWLH